MRIENEIVLEVLRKISWLEQQFHRARESGDFDVAKDLSRRQHELCSLLLDLLRDEKAGRIIHLLGKILYLAPLKSLHLADFDDKSMTFWLWGYELILSKDGICMRRPDGDESTCYEMDEKHVRDILAHVTRCRSLVLTHECNDVRLAAACVYGDGREEAYIVFASNDHEVRYFMTRWSELDRAMSDVCEDRIGGFKENARKVIADTIRYLSALRELDLISDSEHRRAISVLGDLLLT